MNSFSYCRLNKQFLAQFSFLIRSDSLLQGLVDLFSLFFCVLIRMLQNKIQELVNYSLLQLLILQQRIMGQINCNCRYTLAPQYQNQFTSVKIDQNSTKIKNKINSILSTIPTKRLQTNLFTEPQGLRDDVLILKDEFKSTYVLLDSKQNTEFCFASDDDQQMLQETNFKLYLRYLRNSNTEGNFYCQDRGVGLGCFYLFNQVSKIRIQQEMLINVDNHFISIQNLFENESGLTIKWNSIHHQQVVYKDVQDIFTIGSNAQCNINLDKQSNVQIRLFKQRDIWYMMNSYNSQEVWIYLNSMTKIVNNMKIRCADRIFVCSVEKTA